MAEQKTVTLRLPIEQVQWIENLGVGINQGVVETIERVVRIAKYADRDLRNVFSEAEWCYIADSLNGTMVEGDFRYYAAALCANVVDSATYDHLDVKWGVEVKSLTDKISALSSSAIEAIHRRVESFWESGDQPLEQWAKY